MASLSGHDSNESDFSSFENEEISERGKVRILLTYICKYVPEVNRWIGKQCSSINFRCMQYVMELFVTTVLPAHGWKNYIAIESHFNDCNVC